MAASIGQSVLAKAGDAKHMEIWDSVGHAIRSGSRVKAAIGRNLLSDVPVNFREIPDSLLALASLCKEETRGIYRHD